MTEQRSFDDTPYIDRRKASVFWSTVFLTYYSPATAVNNDVYDNESTSNKYRTVHQHQYIISQYTYQNKNDKVGPANLLNFNDGMSFDDFCAWVK